MLKLFNKNFAYGISAILMGLTIFFIYVIFANLDTPKNLVETSRVKTNVIADCGEKAREFDFETVKPNVRANYYFLEIKQTHVDDPMDFAIKTSMLQEYCKKMELTTYCLGNECKVKDNEDSYQFRMVLTAM